MTKRLLYVGAKNRDLFAASWRLVGGEFRTLSDPGAADLAVLDRGPEDTDDLLTKIRLKTPRILCVPPLSGKGGNGGKFLRVTKRLDVMMTAMTTPRFHPGLAAVLEILGSGVLGTDVRAEIKRRGAWPFFPATRDDDALSEWWDRLWLYQAGSLKNGRVETACDERFEFELTLVGSTGRVVHRQAMRENGWCEWTVDSDMGKNGRRRRSGGLPAELPLAIELSRALKSPIAPLTNRDMKKWTDRERDLV